MRTFLVLLLILATAMPAATAHKTVMTSDGTIKITWGFEDEPAATYSMNAIIVRLVDNTTTS